MPPPPLGLIKGILVGLLTLTVAFGDIFDVVFATAVVFLLTSRLLLYFGEGSG